MIGNDNRGIVLDYFDYEEISDFISLDEVIENNILKEPLFVVIADFAEDMYGTDTRITGITDNYALAQSIAKSTNGIIKVAQKNKAIDVSAGWYLE